MSGARSEVLFIPAKRSGIERGTTLSKTERTSSESALQSEHEKQQRSKRKRAAKREGGIRFEGVAWALVAALTNRFLESTTFLSRWCPSDELPTTMVARRGLSKRMTRRGDSDCRQREGEFNMSSPSFT